MFSVNTVQFVFSQDFYITYISFTGSLYESSLKEVFMWLVFLTILSRMSKCVGKNV